MSSRNKAKGTRFETDVVNFIKENKPNNEESREL